ncbi:MAG: PqqD family protein, partial [Caldilineaceae bacterium]|nr:PqqD family protein [Caldilineaceae bacterium]
GSMNAANLEQPQRRVDLLVTDTGNELMLYDSAAGVVHVLNETSKLIWRLCDGNHTVAAIADEVEIHFAVAPGVDVKADVRRVLQTLSDKGII